MDRSYNPRSRHTALGMLSLHDTGTLHTAITEPLQRASILHGKVAPRQLWGSRGLPRCYRTGHRECAGSSTGKGIT